MRSTTVFTILSLVAASLAKTYTCGLHTSGNDFYEDFEFEAIDDPTRGRVQYVNRATAERLNLTFATEDSFVLRADDTTVLKPNGPGRSSVRLKSVMKYVNHVAIFDIRHMPAGCGTWPAVWEVGERWPDNGEIDILEGVNDQGPNAVTLHTDKGCVMSRTSDGGSRKGQRTDSVVVHEDCNVEAKSNAGCPTKLADPKSYGPAFNKNGGGHYAIERTSEFIKVWFWARGDPVIPEEVKDGDEDIDTDTWGEPAAFFPAENCNIDEKFGPQNIIINLTFCGDWSGNVFERNCPGIGNCISHVNAKPEAFKEAYFDFASINTYLA